MSVAGLERMTTGSAVSALSYRATQVDNVPKVLLFARSIHQYFHVGYIVLFRQRILIRLVCIYMAHYWMKD